MSIVNTDSFTIPSDPIVIKKLKDLCLELSYSSTRAEAERDFQKEAIAELSKDTEVPAKYIKKIAKIFHKSNRDSVEDEQNSTVELYDSIFAEKITSPV